MYRKHAARLWQTGGGLDDENPENSQNKRLKYYYIPGEGPDESTPGDALNLVDKAVVICRVWFLQNPKQAVYFQAEGQLFVHWDTVWGGWRGECWCRDHFPFVYVQVFVGP